METGGNHDQPFASKATEKLVVWFGLSTKAWDPQLDAGHTGMGMWILESKSQKNLEFWCPVKEMDVPEEKRN